MRLAFYYRKSRPAPGMSCSLKKRTAILLPMMKSVCLKTAAALIAVLFATSAMAGEVFQSLELQESAGQVVVRWVTSDETGCSGFVVERSSNGVDYTAITSSVIAARGTGTLYEYTDPYVFKQTSRTFTYRIRAEMGIEGQTYSPLRTIEVSVSGIQQSWGGLKAMFR